MICDKINIDSHSRCSLQHWLGQTMYLPTDTSPSWGRVTKSPIRSRGSSGWISLVGTEIKMWYLLLLSAFASVLTCAENPLHQFSVSHIILLHSDIFCSFEASFSHFSEDYHLWSSSATVPCTIAVGITCSYSFFQCMNYGSPHH